MILLCISPTTYPTLYGELYPVATIKIRSITVHIYSRAIEPFLVVTKSEHTYDLGQKIGRAHV